MRRNQPWLTIRARTLRSQRISAEHVLWLRLRSRQLGGFKFIRQCPIGPYFADFVCRERKLVVEVDGGTHARDGEMRADDTRANYLNQHGYRIFRAQNADLYDSIDCVLDALLGELMLSLSPPEGEGAKNKGFSRRRPSP